MSGLCNQLNQIGASCLNAANPLKIGCTRVNRGVAYFAAGLVGSIRICVSNSAWCGSSVVPAGKLLALRT